MRVANRNAREFVQSERPFVGSNLYAKTKTSGDESWYVVYSYRDSWPMFVKANGQWYENENKYSITTSRHHSQAHPQCETTKLPVELMRILAAGGYQALAKARVTGEV